MPESLLKSESLDRPVAQKNAAVLIVAAGSGVRAGGERPKQYQMVGGRMLLRRTLDAFVHHPRVALIQLVIRPDDMAMYEQAAAGLALPPPVAGGRTRQQSVLAGLEALDRLDAKPDYVLVHDAARPFVSHALIDAVLDALDPGAAGALPALAISDTVKRASNMNKVLQTIDRNGLYTAQTPQGFPLSLLLAANRQVDGDSLTDDASIMEAAGYEIRMVPGSMENFKITQAADFDRAERYLMQTLSDIRVGQGFDVHRFEAGDHLWLGGVRIDHDKALKGHSDADVALHALTDALLGAISAGDIGDHFPPSDPVWAGASSDRFLAFAAARVADMGGRIAHVDLTIICEAPKIGPHRAAIRARIASILNIAGSRVSIKATTTEQLGFTGRGEGIAAQATATVNLPMEAPHERT